MRSFVRSDRGLLTQIRFVMVRQFSCLNSLIHNRIASIRSVFRKIAIGAKKTARDETEIESEDSQRQGRRVGERRKDA